MLGAQVAPQVNCADLPETQLLNRGRSQHSQARVAAHRGQQSKSKFRAKSLAYPNQSLPALLEDNIDGVHSAQDSEEKSLPWSCSSCTFTNSGWLQRCEMCGNLASGKLKDAAQSTAIEMEDRPSEEKAWDAEQEWPSLIEAIHAFADCEVSSVGSSWLDIGDADAIHCDGDIILMNPSESLPPETSWAARAKSIAAVGPVASLPVSGVVAPLLQKIPPRRANKVIKSAPLDDVDWDLEGLQNRRLSRQIRKVSPCRQSWAKRRQKQWYNPWF
jgi:hypothetical protein